MSYPENGDQQTDAPATYAKAVWTLETLVCPYIGSRPIAKLGATDVLKVLKRIEGRGIHETAHRTRQRCSQVFRYAVQTERAAHDVTADLRGTLASVVSEHHAAITEPPRIGGYEPQWRIPARKMKMGEQHLVPLSKQAVALLRELQPTTGRGPYVSHRSAASYTAASLACKGDRLLRAEIVESCGGVAASFQRGDNYLTETIGVSIAKRVWPEYSPEWTSRR